MLYFSFIGGEGMTGAGSAPDVGWFAYAPLTAGLLEGAQHGLLDSWLLIGGFGTIATAINIITTIALYALPGMTLTKMPLLVWLNLVMCGMVLIAVSPLTAAQIMLLLDRFRRLAFLRHTGRRLRHSLDAFLLDFRSSRGLYPDHSRFRLRFGNHSGIFAQSHLRLSGDGRRDRRHRIREHERLGAPHVHGRNDLDGNTFFVVSTMMVGVPTGIKIFNWLGTMWGGKTAICHAHDIQHRIPVSVPDRRT